MNENRLLWGFFAISVTAHTALFLMMKGFPTSFLKPDISVIEVTYVQAPPFKEQLPNDELTKKENQTSVKQESPLTESLVSSSIMPDYKPVTLPVPPPRESSLDIPTDLEKDNNYQKYYQSVRLQIQLTAEKNYRGFKSIGMVHLSFVVGKKGGLKNIYVYKEDTSANDFLLQVAIRSVKDASPFLSFPPELPHEELPFSIYIEFKRN